MPAMGVAGHRSLGLGAALFLLGVAGCADEAVQVLQSGQTTYYEDVTPVLAEHCWCCHQEDGVAASLERRAEVERELESILRAIEDGAMPPGGAAPGCAPLTTAAPVAETELDVLRAWRGEGMPEGDPANATAVPGRCGVLRDPTIRLDNGGYAFDGEPTVESRCFVVDPGLEEDRFLTGMRVEPGSEVVRFVMLVPTKATSPPPGEAVDCPVDGREVPSSVLAGWFGAATDLVYPEGTGIRLEAGSHLMLRVQYDARLAEGPLPPAIDTAVELGVVSSVDRQAQITLSWNLNIELEPGRERVTDEPSLTLLEGSRVHGLGVLMQDYGVRARVTAGSTCLLDLDHRGRIPRIHWLASPVTPGAAPIATECVYDTTGAPEVLGWGDPPDGELCITSLYVSR